MKFLFLLLALYITPQAQAQNDCPSISLDETDSDIRGIQVWNQGPTPSCYLYSSSFMATAWIRKNWPDGSSFLLNPAMAYENLMGANAEVKDPILDAENGRTCMSLHWLLGELKSQFKGSLSFPKCKMFGFYKTSEHQNLRAPEEFKARLKELISKKEIFSIEYCSGALNHSGREFIKNRIFDSTLTYLNSPEQYKNFDSSCGFHVSVVVGQALREGKCQARIRNSWGTQNGENGYNWVDLDDLAKNTLRIVTFE